ncbi:MAG: FeoA domain-containing protein, partial [Gemmatimonadota bacterium]|nr:FeoA domain-containing protein [Gemmatimonadota bacterium]
MVADPRVALLVFAGLVVVVAVLTWPRHGVLSKLARLAQLTERVLAEDALKYLHGIEQAHGAPSLESVAGALDVSRSRALRVLQRLDRLGFARTGATGLHLTEAGRHYALRLVRTHRLWERYLADETGVAPADWHEYADTREHALSSDEADALSARMGHPLYDPHGDPIPTAAGDLPPATGRPLTALVPGEGGWITHVEDEPRSAFEGLVAAGLAAGGRLRVLERVADGLVLDVDGRSVTLDATLAAQVTVGRRAGPGEEVSGTSLADLRPGEAGVVERLLPALRGRQRRRLLDLGLVPGTEVTAELDSIT